MKQISTADPEVLALVTSPEVDGGKLASSSSSTKAAGRNADQGSGLTEAHQFGSF